LFTAEGRVMHENAHEEQFENRGSVRIERGMPLRSLSLGLIGKSDVVEFNKLANGSFNVFPVEYKRGKPKVDDCDVVQLCAQAMCLEEMLNVKIEKGALYYGKTRHRFDVVFDMALRDKTIATVKELHQFIHEGKTPRAEYNKKCESCSLFNLCMPKTTGKNIPVREFIQKEINEI